MNEHVASCGQDRTGAGDGAAEVPNLRFAFPFGLRAPNGPIVSSMSARKMALDKLREGDSQELLNVVMAEEGFHLEAWRKKDADARPRWGVAIPVRGRHDLVKRCLAGLERLRDSGDLHVILSGSIKEGTELVNMLEDCRLAGAVSMSQAQLGFAANSNAAFACTGDCDRILFLNSDADPRMLGSIAGAFDSALDLADAAGPLGTNVSGFQRYAWDSEPLEVRLAMNPRAVRAPEPRLVGFAMAVNSDVFFDVGGWDEGFGVGNFDDDDLSLRIALASQKPLRLAFVPSAFVDHVGSASFAALPDAAKTYNDAMATNRVRFLKRWGWCYDAISEWWRNGR